MTTRTEKCKEILDSYKKRIFDFNPENGFKRFKALKMEPKEDGTYLTIRCGLSGIYTYVNEWNKSKGGWQIEILDGSETIAFSKDQELIEKLKEICA